jgi:hypothetical protein
MVIVRVQTAVVGYGEQAIGKCVQWWVRFGSGLFGLFLIEVLLKRKQTI